MTAGFIYKPKLLIIASLLSISLFIGLTHRAHAASGITVSPALLETELSDSVATTIKYVSVRNDFPVAVRVGTSIGGLEQTGKNLVPSSNVDPGLVAATKILTGDTTLNPGQSVNVQVQFSNVPELGPGGHYGALLIKLLPAEAENLTLQQAISVTMFVVKEGGAVRSIALTDVKLQRNIFRAPKFADLTFKNTGNVHIVPRGTVDLLSGETLHSRGIVNEPSSPLFPGREIVLRSSLERLKLPIMPGYYDISVSYRFDDTGRYTVQSVRFLYLPPWTLAAVFVLLVAIGFAHGKGWFNKVYRVFGTPKRRLSSRRKTKKPKYKKPAPAEVASKKPKKSAKNSTEPAPKKDALLLATDKQTVSKSGVEVVSYSRIRARRNR